MDRAYSQLTIKSVDEGTGTITGFASTPQTDRVGDVVEPKGAVFNLPIPLLLSHDHNQPVGAVTEAAITPEGVRVVAKLALEASDRIRETWSLVKAGALRGLSIGFQALEHEPIPGGGLRFTRWDWMELSIVAVPANAGASIENIKSFGAKPLGDLRIHPVSKARKESKPMTIATRIDGLEQVANAALVPWLSRMKALGHADASNIEGIARSMGAPADLAAKIKAAVGAEVSGDAPGLSGHSAAVTSFISQASAQSVFARIFAERWMLPVPFNTRLISIGVDATAAVVGGGLPIPVQGLDWNDPLIVEPEKIGAALVLTNELWSDASAAGQAFVNAQLRAAVAAACDAFLFDKLAAGLESTVTTQDARPDPDSLRFGLLESLNSVHTRAAGNLVWAISPAAANGLMLMEDDSLRLVDGMLAGVPAVATSGFNGMRMGLIDAAAIGGNIERLEIISANEGSIEMADDPTNSSTGPVGTQVVSLFQTESTAVKYILSLGLEPVRDTAAAFIQFEEIV